jgi:sigma-B regulation protein RsbU (phosphoserine phosphatase)
MRTRLLAELDQVVRGQEALAQQGPTVVALQTALQARTDPVPGLAVASRLQPAAGVLAGDWVDTLGLPGGRLAVVLGDVSGHGPEAAVFALRLKHMLAATLTSGRSPGESIAWTTHHLGETGEMFATVFVAVIDPTTDQLVYASGGHPEALLRVRTVAGASPPAPFGERRATPRALPPPQVLAATGPLVNGLVAGSTWDDVRLPFRRGDLLVACTDGLLEARDAEGEQFGQQRFAATLTDDVDLDELLQRALDQVRDHAGQRLTDDCSLVACRHD